MNALLDILYIVCWEILIVGTVLFTVLANGRLARDKISSRELTFVKGIIEKFPWLGFIAFDKIQHFLGGIILGFLFNLKGLYFAWAWEFKDTIVPYEKLPKRFKKWGGDGFSYWDGLATSAGVYLGSMLSIIFGLYPALTWEVNIGEL